MSQMSDKLFCSAQYRPSYCKVSTNLCCFNCEHNISCTATAKHRNKALTKKELLPCSADHVGVNEICEFAC